MDFADIDYLSSQDYLTDALMGFSNDPIECGFGECTTVLKQDGDILVGKNQTGRVYKRRLGQHNFITGDIVEAWKLV